MTFLQLSLKQVVSCIIFKFVNERKAQFADNENEFGHYAIRFGDTGNELRQGANKFGHSANESGHNSIEFQ